MGERMTLGQLKKVPKNLFGRSGCFSKSCCLELRLTSVLLAFVVVGLIGSIRPTTAHSVTFDFTGTFVAADPHSLGGIFTAPILSYPASTITGSFTFEADTPDANGSDTVGLYNGAIQNLLFAVTKPITADAYQFGLDLSGSSGRPVQNVIMVNASSTTANQSYVLSASVQNQVPAGSIIDGGDYFAREFSINLINPSGSAFTTDALPETPPDRNLFSLYSVATNPSGQFRLVFASSHGDHTLIGNLTSLTLGGSSPAPIPIPAAVYLFGSGVAAIAVFARRRPQ
jgi:hypothetical protein